MSGSPRLSAKSSSRYPKRLSGCSIRRRSERYADSSRTSSLFYTTTSIAFRVIFGNEVKKHLLRAIILDMSGVEVQYERDFTDEEKTRIIEIGTKRVKKGQAQDEMIGEKYEQCLQEDAVRLHAFAFTEGYADTRREFELRDLYHGGLMPFVRWVCCSACNFDPQYQATSIAYRADRRATHAPNNSLTRHRFTAQHSQPQGRVLTAAIAVGLVMPGGRLFEACC